ncbi:MAG: RecQ family ATP-dependent DNA helicase [Longimicrobiales bacterium]
MLRSRFGFPAFRPGQEELIRAVLAGRDALGVLPTGGGKSVCYQVPAMMLDGITVVVSPLVSLMEDQVGRARAVGLRSECLTAVQSREERRSVLRALRGRRLDLLFVSPERLSVASFRRSVEEVRLSLIAVDEAHCISEWGHDFRPAYRSIGGFRSDRSLPVPVLALTASATPPVRRDVCESLRLQRPAIIVHSFDRPNLWWSIERVPRSGHRLESLVRWVFHARGAGIVYAPTRNAVEGVRHRLSRSGISAESYHAGLPGPVRSAVQRRFMDSATRVVVATNAFGMGIDKPDVRFVTHLCLPTTLEAYYQEAGRAGRDGSPSRCVAYHGPSDRRLGVRFVDRTHPPEIRLRWLHWRLCRLAGRARTLDCNDPRIPHAVGPGVEPWRRGDASGAFAALERIEAIRGCGTVTVDGVSVHERVRVLNRPKWLQSKGLRRSALARLAAVQRLAASRGCRRNGLLHYFGEVAEAGCGRCDCCGWDSGPGWLCPDG